MTRRRSWLSVIVCVIVSAPLNNFCSGAEQESLLEKWDCWQLPILFSYAIDSCGKINYSEIMRRALKEKFEGCPFSEKARNKFRAFIEELEIRKGGMVSFFQNRPSHKEACDKIGNSQSFEQIERYNRGEISVHVLIPGPCLIADCAL